MNSIIPRARLRKWAILKYGDKYSTIQLMSLARDSHDKLVISIVALLEVREDQRYLGMTDLETGYVIQCHHYINSLLETTGSCEGVRGWAASRPEIASIA